MIMIAENTDTSQQEANLSCTEKRPDGGNFGCPAATAEAIAAVDADAVAYEF